LRHRMHKVTESTQQGEAINQGTNNVRMKMTPITKMPKEWV